MAITLGDKKSKRPEPSINMTPLVDVMLVLLIIFMVVTPLMTRQVTVRVVGNGAAAPSTPPSNERPPQIVVSADGNIKVNRLDTDLMNLERAVRTALTDGNTKLVQLQASDRAPYEQIVRVLDVLRAAGARDIAVVTSPS
jgi:biopolymer transport protein ExbD/biopolymer transport protein TolR